MGEADVTVDNSNILTYLLGSLCLGGRLGLGSGGQVSGQGQVGSRGRLPGPHTRPPR